MLKRNFAVVAALVLAPCVRASAQVSFPPDAAYSPWPCQNGAMSDPRRDESGAINERDLVGDEAAPAGLRAVDSQYLYVRLRVDADPTPSSSARAWGLLVDIDGVANTYEVMLAADGAAGKVYIYTNSSSATVGDARDPPDALYATYSWSTNARTVTAPGSSYGGNADYFVDLAFPWTDLEAVGLTPTKPVRVWAATSTTPSNGLDGDFACWDDSAVILASTWPTTVTDPAQVDSDNDGFSDSTEIQSGTDPYDPASYPGNAPHLAGGGGCHHGTAGIAALAALVPLLIRARRARASSPSNG